MVIVGRSLKMTPGTWTAAIEWATEFTQYINDSLASLTPFQLLQGQFGDDDGVHRLLWVVSCENLDDYQKLMEKVFADEGVQERLNKMGDMFVLDSIIHQSYRVIV